MKKYGIILTILVLTLSILTGCGCTPQKETGPAAPTRNTAPTVPETTAVPTVPPTQVTIPETIIPDMTTDTTEDAASAPTGDMTDSTGPNSGDMMTRGRRTR